MHVIMMYLGSLSYVQIWIISTIANLPILATCIAIFALLSVYEVPISHLICYLVLSYTHFCGYTGILYMAVRPAVFGDVVAKRMQLI